MPEHTPLYEALGSLGEVAGEPIPVTLSPELIGLLSEQLYRSPSKAIEELVVNAYDAEATEARVFVGDDVDESSYVVVYDNGIGMSYEGLADLWKVGRQKQRDETIFERKNRKQIGKFGIGKLATYSIANRVTYLTKVDEDYFGVTIDYGSFIANPDATTTEVNLDVRKIDDASTLWSEEIFRTALESIDIHEENLQSEDSWTVVILEEMKEKAKQLKIGRLRWVLRTAMPLGDTFFLYLNGKRVTSSKEDYEGIIEFGLGDLPKERIDDLESTTELDWIVEDQSLFSEMFPSGIRADVLVTRESLKGKSSDILRSEGFFIYVRDRLINLEDARFGLHELSHQTMNRFRALVWADDLDSVVKANRESVEEVDMYEHLKAVLNAIFNEARGRYEDYLKSLKEGDNRRAESERNWVSEHLVELPTADTLVDYHFDRRGAEPDDSWMYSDIGLETDVQEIAKGLYAQEDRDHTYRFEYSSFGRGKRFVRFHPERNTFVINTDHEFTIAYADEPASQRLFHDVAAGEVFLEVYLREAGIVPHTVGEILDKRDQLLRGLANSQMSSLSSLGRYIRDSADASRDLEIAVVAGSRALGFVAKHLGGSGEPDGIARFADYPGGEEVIVLEAKSSIDVPSAKDIDFASIAEHVASNDAIGCLLVAPAYRGDEDGMAAKSAERLKISCWTVNNFADVVASAVSRQISARDILDIVLNVYTPQEVESAVEALMSSPAWSAESLYGVIVEVLKELRSVLKDEKRHIAMVATKITERANYQDIEMAAIRDAVSELAAASQGALVFRNKREIVLNVDCEELERRVERMIGKAGPPRRTGAFLED